MRNLEKFSVFFLFIVGLNFSSISEARCKDSLLLKSSHMHSKSFIVSEDLLKEATKVLKRNLNKEQSEAIIKAHYVGLGALGKDKIHDAGVDNFTRTQLAIKARVLRAAGFSVTDVRLLMENRIVGFEIFLAGYGMARLGMDLWDYFTYSPKTVQNLKREFIQQKAEMSSLRNPKDLFYELFESFVRTEDMDGLYVYPIGTRGVNNEYTIWKRKFDRNEQAAFLIKGSDGAEELLLGRPEPIANDEERKNERFGKINLHTNEGVRSFSVSDIVAQTTLDIRSRVKFFEDTFKNYQPRQIQFNAYKADLENTRELDFHVGNYKLELHQLANLKERNGQIALLTKTEDGSQRLVVGRVDYEKSFHGRPRTKTRKVPNPKSGWFEPKFIDQSYEDPNDLAGGEVIDFFVIATSEGKIERIPYKSVLRYTTVDLRVRSHLFVNEFKEFEPASPFGSDSADLSKAVKDYLTYKDTDSYWMLNDYKRALAAFEKKEPLAFLVQRKNGVQSLVVGIPEAIFDSTNDGAGVLRSLKMKRIDNGQTEELALSEIINYTQKSVRSHSGVNIVSLIQLFEAMPVRASVESVQDFARMTIYDALNLTQKESALQVAGMSSLDKLNFLQRLLGAPLSDLQKEGLLQAILIGNLPTSSEEVGKISSVNRSYSAAVVEAKYRSLKNVQFTHEEIVRIAQSGALGVLQLK